LKVGILFYEENKLMKRTVHFVEGALQERLQGLFDKIDRMMRGNIEEVKKEKEEQKEKIEVEYKKHLADARENIEKKHQAAVLFGEKEYQKACELFDTAKTAEEYQTAGKAFEKIIKYKDSREQVKKCYKRVKEAIKDVLRIIV
jgi:hypothetical protein